MLSIKNNIKKSARLIFVDFFGLVVGILNGFFLPMVFSIEGYALFRTFTLYATYAVVFSFGLTDGLYLILGGKEESKIDVSKTKAYYFFLIKLQAAIFVVLFILSYLILKDTALIFFSFFIMPLQLIHFFRLYYRALGEFDKYSSLQIVLVVLELLNTLFIVFYFKSDNPNLFITFKILNHIIVAVLFTIIFYRNHKDAKTVKLERVDYYKVMKSGFIVLMADMAAALMFSLDRWFVMIFFSKQEFAYYSFAVSILNLFLVFITSITNIFYSYISKRIKDCKYIKNLKNYVLIVSSFFPLGYFLLKFIIETYLLKYVDALEVLWILVLMLPFISVVNVLYVNLYKASKSIKIYLKRMIVMLFISFVLNILAVSIFDTTAAISWATLISFIIWYIYSSKDFESVAVKTKEIVYLSVLIISFIWLKVADFNLLLSIFIFLLILIIDVITFYKDDSINILKTIRNNLYR